MTDSTRRQRPVDVLQRAAPEEAGDEVYEQQMAGLIVLTLQDALVSVVFMAIEDPSLVSVGVHGPFPRLGGVHGHGRGQASGQQQELHHVAGWSSCLV